MICPKCRRGTVLWQWVRGALAEWSVLRCDKCAARSTLEASVALAQASGLKMRKSDDR